LLDAIRRSGDLAPERSGAMQRGNWRMAAASALCWLALALPAAAQTPEQTFALMMFGHAESDPDSPLYLAKFEIERRDDCRFRFVYAAEKLEASFDFRLATDFGLKVDPTGTTVDVVASGKPGFVAIRHNGKDAGPAAGAYRASSFGFLIPARMAAQIAKAREQFVSSVCKIK
jgi:hypothetical protein